MNLLKKLRNKERELCWDNITVKEWMQIERVLAQDGDELDKSIEFLKILTGKDYGKVPIKEYMDKVQELSFLQTNIPTVICPNKLEVNGRKYDITLRAGEISTAQFMDYLTMCKDKSDGMLARIASVFMIPEGHSYADGYDFQQVREDALDMPFIKANSIAFFLQNQQTKSSRPSLFSLIYLLMMNKTLTKKEKMSMLKDVNTLWQTMESYHTF